jgi:hypothetical protein
MLCAFITYLPSQNMAYNTHLLRYKKIINEWHRELLAYVDGAEQQAGVPTIRPPFPV